MKRIDLRLAVALDARTGEKLWSTPVDVTDCSEIGIGGGKLTLMHKEGVLLLCGATPTGITGSSSWPATSRGDGSWLFRPTMVASCGPRTPTTGTGRSSWASRSLPNPGPLISAAASKMREHPLTGQQVPWSIIRPGHHCGMISGCENMLLFRSGYTGFYDLKADDGTQHIAGHRLGCWINAIPANGLVMIPEATAGCVCLFSIASTVVMEPREPHNPWTI